MQVIQGTGNIFYRLAVIALSGALGACVVTPKKVASYDDKCMVSTQKVVLTAEQMQIFDARNCISKSCSAELFNAVTTSVITTTTTAIVSGSIALVGNTLYWVESQGKCPNFVKPSESAPKDLQTPSDEYTLEEEIITAKS